MLLIASDLSQAFVARLTAATSVYLAVAWITSKEHAEQLAVAASTKKVLVLVGVSDYITSPAALTILLNSGCQLAIAPEHPKFHPKVYIFEGRTTDLCWVGSANLTHSGFTQNVELVNEFESSEVRKWFDGVWGSGNTIDQGWIDAYTKNCPVARPTTLASSVPPFPEQPTAFGNWGSYYRAILRAHTLIKADPEFGIFSGKNSYLNVLRAAEPIMEKDWESLRTKK